MGPTILRDVFMILAGAATAALVAKVALLVRMAINRPVFLDYIHRLVEKDMERAIKLASVQQLGPVVQLCRVALIAIDGGRAASVPRELETRSLEWIARVRFLGWPIRILGMTAILGGVLVLAQDFALAAGWSAFIALLVVYELSLERRLVTDIRETVRAMSEIAHRRAA
jgi:hypothetical protein